MNATGPGAATTHALTARYRQHVLAAAPRLLGSLDREPLSPTSGSFDRDHWGWYFRDVPIGMLQSGLLPLAALWAGDWPGNPYVRSPRLLDWIIAGLEQSMQRQHRNGSFDSVGPNTQDHGVTLQMVYVLTTTMRYLGSAAPAALASRAAEVVRRGCAFAARSDEDYAFISNHRALFALAWLRAGDLLQDDELYRRADLTLRAIIDRQAAEGWYREYDGADPGYQSLGMAYLTQLQSERPSSELADSLRRAVDFMAHFVHPDGGVGGVYGSRMTALWFPSGFEQLAAGNPLAAAVADAVLEGIESANVVTPSTTDAHNLAVILHSYLLAADARAAREATTPTQPPVALPRDWLTQSRRFGESGLVVAGSPRYYAVLNLRRGGVGVIHARDGGRIAFTDAGYVAGSEGGRWSSAVPVTADVSVPDDEGTCTVQARFGLVNRPAMTAGRFLLLRLLNLTVFRSITIGALVRRLLVQRLITRRQAGPITLRRTVRFREDTVVLHDRLERTGKAHVDSLVRTTAYSPFHMGSARYFLARELHGTPDIDHREAARSLNTNGSASLQVEISFGPDGTFTVREGVDPAADALPTG
jgi:hypothetical protein